MIKKNLTEREKIDYLLKKLTNENTPKSIGKCKVLEQLQITTTKQTQELTSKGVPIYQILENLPKIDNIINIISDVEVLKLAYSKIRTNKGATTNPPYQKTETIDGISNKRFNYISAEVKNGTYDPLPVSQIMIPKPGKVEKRPLGIPHFNDKIVQEAIRLVLNAIYDPIFEITNYNHGFRPNKSTHTAVHHILYKIQGLNTAIEGDIKGAYPNINYNTLLKILSKRISDKKLLKLIWKYLNAGLFNTETKSYAPTDLGVPQGQIASPILFNIYMYEFDMFILENIENQFIPQLNQNRDPVKIIPAKFTANNTFRSQRLQNKASSAYNSARNRKDYWDKKILEYKQKINKPLSQWDDSEKENLKNFKTNRFKALKIQEKTNYSNVAAIPLRIFYRRYADDWIIFTNASKQISLQIKDKISKFLKDELQMTLSEDKTKITDITSEPSKFLGFAIGKNENNYYINPDTARILTKLKIKGFCEKNGFPREKPAYSTYDEKNLISYFNSCLLGLMNYYYPVVTTTSQLNRAAFIIKYSCLKTLAQKKKTSLTKIIKKIGGIQNSQYPITKRIRNEKEFTNETHYLKIHGYKSMIQSYSYLEKTRKEYKYKNPTSEIYSQRISMDFTEKAYYQWRTKSTLLDAYCIVCGSSENVQSHHVNSIRSLKNKLEGKSQSIRSNFQNILKVINRKQIPLCAKHHDEVTNSSIKLPYMNSLYDYRKNQGN